MKLLKFLKYFISDVKIEKSEGKKFREYGVTIYCGEQGSGKTISVVERLEFLKNKYPDCLIITNFGYVNQNYELNSWRDLLNYRNDDKGVVFVIDEIQNEFSSTTWKDFPDWLLTEISQQRKQKIKIILTAQCYKDVVVQIRRQCLEVVECYTFGNRWTFQRCFYANDYNRYIESNSLDNKFKVKRKWRYNFVQSDEIRNLFNSYQKIERLKNTKFIDNKLLKNNI